jgi:hypothetical protein
LHGETVNENGALTAKVLFDPIEIQSVRGRFELYTGYNYAMGQVIPFIAKQNGFIEYLRKRNVRIESS